MFDFINPCHNGMVQFPEATIKIVIEGGHQRDPGYMGSLKPEEFRMCIVLIVTGNENARGGDSVLDIFFSRSGAPAISVRDIPEFSMMTLSTNVRALPLELGGHRLLWQEQTSSFRAVP
jgi:hypothetical protein